MKNKVIALCDCNSFYASCEKAFNPKLQHLPTVVLSNNDGNVIARCPLAKALGIEMGVPYHQIKHIIHQHQVQVFSSNFALYGDISARVMSILAEFTPEIEIYSIDESFLDFSGFVRRDLTAYCHSIRTRVKKCTGIPVSIGVGSSKTIAKIANHIVKKTPEYDGIFNLTTIDPEPVLAQVDVEDIWGVGQRTAKALRIHGINTALQLRQALPGWIKQRFGVVMLRTVLELQGFSCLPLEQCPPPKQSITCSRSFGYPVDSLAEIKEAVATYTSRAGEKLRHELQAATAIVVFIATNRYSGTPQYSNSVTVQLPVATNDTTELVRYALAGVVAIYRAGYQYKKAGVILLGLVSINLVQPHLFDCRDRERYQVLMQTMDLINRQFGAGTIQVAAAGLRKPWQGQKAWRSPRYTTHWSEIPIVKC